jgi:hypothetical protein
MRKVGGPLPRRGTARKFVVGSESLADPNWELALEVANDRERIANQPSATKGQVDHAIAPSVHPSKYSMRRTLVCSTGRTDQVVFSQGDLGKARDCNRVLSRRCLYRSSAPSVT